MKQKAIQQPGLTDRTTILVRFSEVDSMRVVWHGEYVRYMEDGRESFGSRFGLGYQEISGAGFVVPIVDMQIKYKQSLRHGDSVVIETKYIHTYAAKILFEYTLYRESDNAVVATGSTTQVFLDIQTGELVLNTPGFYQSWKEKWKLV